MRKSLLLARSNIRKAKGQTVSIIILIFLAGLLLNLTLMLSSDYKRNFDRYSDKLNSEHATFVINRRGEDLNYLIKKTVEEDKRTKEYRLDEMLYMNAEIDYNGNINNDFLALRKSVATSRNIGKYEITKESEIKDGIYLPVLFEASKTYSIGDTIEIKLSDSVVSYTVCGFYNNMMTGSFNCSMLSFLLTDNAYEKLEKQTSVEESTMLSVRLNNKKEAEQYEEKVRSEILNEFPVNIKSNNYNLISQSRYTTQLICSGIISAVAVLISAIALIVIASNVINYIGENMKNLGALKAIGYTSRQLIVSLLVQFLFIAFIASIVGIGISYCLFPGLNILLVSQTGIPYAIHFLLGPTILTIVIIGGIIALAVWLSARRLKKIEPIAALRRGIKTHNFKKNHIPLSKTKLPLNTALSFKTAIARKSQAITMIITMLALSLIIVFSSVMYKSFLVDMTPAINLLVGETADSTVGVKVEIEKEFIAAMENDSRVEKIYQMNSTEVSNIGGYTLAATITDNTSKLNNQSLCYEGRLPKFDNEVAIGGKYAKENRLKIGDEMSLGSGGKQSKYIISGFTQSTNYLGKDCILLRKGYEKIGTLDNISFNMNIKKDVDVNNFHDEIGKKFGNSISSFSNLRSALDSSVSVYVSVITVIVVGVLLLCLIVIIFVLYLLVRTMLNSKKLDNGIMKSLGYTSRQLIFQTAASFMPIIIISTIVGLIIGSFAINPLMTIFLGGLGIMKSNFEIPFLFVTIAGITIVLFAFAYACLLSLKIKKIAPYELISHE